MAKDSAYHKEMERRLERLLKKNSAKLPEYAQNYLNSKRQTVRISSLLGYTHDLNVFNSYLEKSIEKVTAEDIWGFQEYLTSGEKYRNGPETIARKMTTLRGLFAYLRDTGCITTNPMSSITSPRKVKDKSIIYLNKKEVQALLRVIREGSDQMTDKERIYALKHRQRNQAFVLLILSTGIRISECCGLDLEDVDYEEKSITIVRKGGGQDVLYFDDEVRDVLREYVQGERQQYEDRCKKRSDREALFLSPIGTRLSKEIMEKLVRRDASFAVPAKKVTPHQFRKTYGTMLYKETGDIRLVAEVLGHENVNTTIRYYAAMDEERKKSVAGKVKYE